MLTDADLYRDLLQNLRRDELAYIILRNEHLFASEYLGSVDWASSFIILYFTFSFYFISFFFLVHTLYIICRLGCRAPVRYLVSIFALITRFILCSWFFSEMCKMTTVTSAVKLFAKGQTGRKEKTVNSNSERQIKKERCFLTGGGREA